MTPPGPGIWFGIDRRVLSKFVLVPPGLVEPMLAALKYEGVDLYAEHGELPAIGGMPVIVSRHCPPDTGYILNAEAIPRVEESLWRNTYLGSWEDVEEPPLSALTFSIDYPPAIISYRPRPKLSRWEYFLSRIHWRVWYVWFIVRDWWRTLVEESRSRFQD